MLAFIIKKIVADSGMRPLECFQRCSKVPPRGSPDAEGEGKTSFLAKFFCNEGWGEDNLHRPRQIQVGLRLQVAQLVVDNGIPLDERVVEEASL